MHHRHPGTELHKCWCGVLIVREEGGALVVVRRAVVEGKGGGATEFLWMLQRG
jgi:hypothetical protein